MDCGVVGGQPARDLGVDALRHAHLDRVPEDPAEHRERKACVPGGGLDDRLARRERAGRAGVLDDPQRDAVLDAAVRVRGFELREEPHPGRGREPPQLHQRGAADEVGRVAGDAASGGRLRVESHGAAISLGDRRPPPHRHSGGASAACRSPRVRREPAPAHERRPPLAGRRLPRGRRRSRPCSAPPPVVRGRAAIALAARRSAPRAPLPGQHDLTRDRREAHRDGWRVWRPMSADVPPVAFQAGRGYLPRDRPRDTEMDARRRR